MSSRMSKLRKDIRAKKRLDEKREKERRTLVEKNRKPGESDEAMLERQKRDLDGWLGMMTERQIEEGLIAKASELKAIEDLQETKTKEEN